MGQKIPDTHIQDPIEIMRRLRISKMMWPFISQRATRIDKRYKGFLNKELEVLPKKEHKKHKEMVVY